LDDNVAERFSWGIFAVSAENMTCQFEFHAWHENFVWAAILPVSVTFENTGDQSATQ
jgi:hypothetical protein